MGDWGRGLVALTPVGSIPKQGPCGDATTRSAFFLHGGWLAGSAGCIDIDGEWDHLADFLAGYGKAVPLTVEYTAGLPYIGFFRGLTGGLNYWSASWQHGPILRGGAEFAPGRTLALTSIEYQGLVHWAGGALTAGVHLDLSLSDRETFVRAGLSGGANFRILGALYGRVFGGPTWPVTGPGSSAQWEVGGGLSYELGRFQLEALYDYLLPAAQEPEVRRAFLGIGFRL